MLRRVKIDVIAEMTEKKEEIVPCKLSSRQQVFYQAIKNKISLNELLDGSRGNLNDKKLLSLMNIVMQLRKVLNLFKMSLGFTPMCTILYLAPAIPIIKSVLYYARVVN
jgi:SNF2 family DNA or RNA helicase